MFESVVTIGDKLHVVTRRRFEGDVRRHFVGEVVGNTGSLCELKGYAMVRDDAAGEWIRRPERRHRILSLAEAGHVVNRIPREVDVEDLHYEHVDGELMVTDGKQFELNLDEFEARG